jgi:LysM repeat protein
MNLYPNSRFLYIFLGLFLLQAAIVAQEPVSVQRSNNKVILGGTVYYVHVVKPGETLYAISKAYNVSQKEIAVENPGVISGLQIGQSLKIPVEPKLSNDVDTSEPPESAGTGRYHTVQPGETLYGIGRLYNLDEEQIKQANPGVTADQLQPGQLLKIPETVKAAEEPKYNEEGFVYHRVKRRETLYSIAGYYNVTVDAIRAVNPELGWGGPKTGQVIKIPARLVTDQPQADNAYIQENDSALFEGNESEEDYVFEGYETRNENRRRAYRIAFFIPFDFQEMEPLDSLTKDVESVTRRNRIIERYMREQSVPQSVQFLEFFQGTLMAIDSMRQDGLKLDVHYYDTRRSTDRTRSILMDDELEDFDLFIGPFGDYNLEIVADFARSHRIPLVTPFHNSLDLVSNNPYLFQLSPSLESGYREAAKLVASKYMYNIVYVRQEDSLDVEKHEYFKQLIFDGFDDYHLTEPVIFKEVILKLDRTEDIIQSLSAEKKNLVVIPTDDEALASTVVSSLFYNLDNYDIEVLGSPFWTEFSSIDFRYYHQLNLLFYSSFWVDYNDPRIEQFMNRFRNEFYGEPTITSKQGMNYGIAGYDMTFYFLNALRTYGSRFILELDDYRPRMVQDAYTFERLSGKGGFENTHINFYRFAPDMSIQKVAVPELPAKHFYFSPMEDRTRRRYLYLDRDNF